MSNQHSHSTAAASEAKSPVIYSLPTDQNSCFLEGKVNTRCATVKTVIRKGQTSHQYMLKIRMSETQARIRTKTRFGVSPERNEDKHYSQYLKYRHHPSSGEDRDVPHKISKPWTQKQWQSIKGADETRWSGQMGLFYLWQQWINT